MNIKFFKGLSFTGCALALALSSGVANANAPVANGAAAPVAAKTATPAPGPVTRLAHAVVAQAKKWSEWGEATWYGPRHAGKRTTSGERFDPSRMTAAHPSLPLGTWVKVTDQDTGRSVVVRINDREPEHGVRVIDLSQGAAKKLGIVNRGVADVTVEVAEAPDK